MYLVEFTGPARRELARLSSEDQKRIIGILERILIRPQDFALKLSGSKAYRLRAGRLRIIIDIEEGEKKILVIKIGNRENVYSP